MKKTWQIILLSAGVLALGVIIPACGAAGSTPAPTATTAVTAAAPTSSTSENPSGSTAAAGIYQTITPEAARDWLAKKEGVVLLDVRTEAEFKEIRIPGSQLLPYDEIAARQAELPADKSAPVIVYCRSGRRSALAAEQLLQLGYTAVYDLGGIQDWPFATEKG